MKLKHLLACALCAAVLCSCGTREDLFDSYDSCFVPIGRNSASFVLTPETQGLMIPGEAYEISLVDVPAVTLSLFCPVECTSYEWKITSLNDGNTVLSDTKHVYKGNQRNFSIYIADYNGYMFFDDLNSGKDCSYRIHLSVKVGTQSFYDSALLVVTGKK